MASAQDNKCTLCKALSQHGDECATCEKYVCSRCKIVCRHCGQPLCGTCLKQHLIILKNTTAEKKRLQQAVKEWIVKQGRVPVLDRVYRGKRDAKNSL
jgi:tRNA/tmRNA/rRNA uracil-C5-methylase (TrmA/RlmC/RlmD family)